VVGSSIISAVRYKYEIENALKAKIEKEKSKPDNERDDELIKRMEFIKAAVVVTQIENNEPGYVSQARKHAHELNAVENFKKDFDFEKPETGVAILCVCDRLLTGFDAPIEQVMYLDKNLREHDLLQAIARVNRTKGPAKNHGIVVDYFGVAKHLKEALAIYTNTDEKEMKDFLEYFRDINKELPVLEARFRRLLHLFAEKGLTEIEAFVNQKIMDKDKEFEVAERCIALAEEVRFRAQFDTYLKSFFDSLDLLFNVTQAREYWIPAKRFGYLLMRIRNRYKDETLDLKWAGEKVRKLIDKHLESLGINSRIPPVKLLSDDFPKEVEKFTTNPRAKASEMEHAIRRHIKVNVEKDPALFSRFNERLDAIIRRFKDNWEEIVVELGKLREEIAQGRKEDEAGVSVQEAPFYDVIRGTAFGGGVVDAPTKEKLKNLTVRVVQSIRQAIEIANFWDRQASVRELRGTLDDELQYCGIAEIAEKHEKLSTELLSLARTRDSELKRG
jgi:type I restriction enzyme R subunit